LVWDRPRRQLSMHIHKFSGEGIPISASMFHSRGRGVVAERSSAWERQPSL
jgi:hypothetical protein